MSSIRKLASVAAAVARMTNPLTAAYCLSQMALAAPSIIRERSPNAVSRRLAGREVSVQCLGVSMKIDGDAFLGALEMYGRRVYFAYPELRINLGDVVLDLGANQGLFTLLASRIGARCVAVEMQSGLLTLISRNLAANGCRAEIAHGLVGPKSGVFSDPAQMRAASHFGSNPPVISLNGLIEEFRLPRIDFLKIDIEGSEFDLFEHDTEWLALTGRIAMEVHGPHGDPERIVDALSSAGFTVRRRTAALTEIEVLHASGYLYAFRA
jgi:FkbM family methyltransferase